MWHEYKVTDETINPPWTHSAIIWTKFQSLMLLICSKTSFVLVSMHSVSLGHHISTISMATSNSIYSSIASLQQWDVPVSYNSYQETIVIFAVQEYRLYFITLGANLTIDHNYMELWPTGFSGYWIILHFWSSFLPLHVLLGFSTISWFAVV